MINQNCPLCKLVMDKDYKTRHYFTFKDFTIVDCDTCRIPMVVFNHCGKATVDEVRNAINIVNTLFDYDIIRKEGRKIPDHEHWHLVGGIYKG